jgi:hypothetical protein
MAGKQQEKDLPIDALTNEFARQRWELFHRAIAHAKRSNVESMQEGDVGAAEPEGSSPLLSVVK